MNRNLNGGVDFARALLQTLPDKIYSPAVFADETGRVVPVLLDRAISKWKKNHIRIVEINCLQDMKQFDVLPEHERKDGYVLIIRDIQQYANSGQIQEKLVKLCDEASKNQTQLIVTSDRAVRKLRLEERLYARLVSGVISEIGEDCAFPDKEQQLQDLMDEWKASHQEKGKSNFIADGFVDADIYKKASPKICFFLKEAYSNEDNGGWDLADWLNNGAMTRM